MEKIIDFAQWYSGMEREKVINAYNRYLREVKSETSTQVDNDALLGVPLPDNFKQIIDLAYLVGAFNVVGMDGLQKEIERLKTINKKPSDIFKEGNG